MKLLNTHINLPLVVGIIDCSIAFSYLLNMPVEVWYAGTLTLKVALAFVFLRKGVRLSQSTSMYLFLLLLLALTSALLNQSDLHSLFPLFGFIAQFILSYALVRVNRGLHYCRGVAFGGLAISVIYLFMLFSGQILDHYGRYKFFGDSHPNLGSEILFISVLCAGLSLRDRYFGLILLGATLSILMMQGRAALLSVIVVFSVRLCIYLNSRWNVFTVKGLILASAVVFIVGVFLFDFIYIGISKTFLLDDQFRGAGTGFVGREDRWAVAINVFLDHPFFGAGIGYFDTAGLPSPHNMYLYAISEIGILSVLIFTVMASAFYKIWSKDRRVFYLISPALILTLFNDRFIDINPYPFCFILIIFLAAAGSKWDIDSVLTERRR